MERQKAASFTVPLTADLDLAALMLVLDHGMTFLGSMNLDFKSSCANKKLGMPVDSEELVRDVVFLAAQLRRV